MFYNRGMDEFEALADPTRRQIIETLAQQGRLSATEIAAQFSVTPQAISHQLKILREANWVLMERRAQQRIYQVNLANVRKLEAWTKQLEQMWQNRYSTLNELIEEEKRKENQPS
jgi:DNA-binding transcriptional ArsR family regulator